MNYPGQRKDKDYYIESLKVESAEQMKFLNKAIENHQKNIRKFEREIEEENAAVAELQAQVDAINSKLNNVDGQATKMLIRDFKADLNMILNGEEAQAGGRFGLNVQKKGPYKIEKPLSVSRDGKRITETRECLITQCRDNAEALETFQAYLRNGYNLPVDGLTFQEVQESIEEFFRGAPSPSKYGPEYEVEVQPRDDEKALFNRFEQVQKKIDTGSSLFRY